MTFVKIAPVAFGPPKLPPSKGVPGKATIIRHETYHSAFYIKADEIVALKGRESYPVNYEPEGLKESRDYMIPVHTHILVSTGDVFMIEGPPQAFHQRLAKVLAGLDDEPEKKEA